MHELRSLIRDLGPDGLKSLPIVGYFFYSGWTIGEWASFAALVYTLVLLSEKAWKGWRYLQQRRA